jgi:hypothetical protein
MSGYKITSDHLVSLCKYIEITSDENVGQKSYINWAKKTRDLDRQISKSIHCASEIGATSQTLLSIS